MIKITKLLSLGRSLQILLYGAVCTAMCGVVTAQTAPPAGNEQVRLGDQQQKLRAEEARRKKLESDAAKLVEMAQQLKAGVDKTNKDVLSVKVVRDAERIERLAHEDREGMRQ